MKSEEKYIGVFDSGVGGLTVVKYLMEQMPKENIVYLADSKHMPYGDKTKEQIIDYVKDDVKFLNNYNLKAVLIACNTADAIASNVIKQTYNIPIYGVIDYAVKQAIKATKNNKIGVIATTATINTNEYTKRILKNNSHIKVISKACPFLVPLIEDGKFDIGNQEIRFILEDYLSEMIDEEIDTLILGCTHYDLLTPIINDMYPTLNVISSSKCVINHIKNDINENVVPCPDQLFFVSSNKNKFQKTASMIIPNIQINEI